MLWQAELVVLSRLFSGLLLSEVLEAFGGHWIFGFQGVAGLLFGWT